MDNKIEKELREKVQENPFALKCQIKLHFPIVQIFPSPQETYIALQVALQFDNLSVKVYRTDTYELVHEHEESKSNYLYVSFNEFEEYMLLYIQPYEDREDRIIKIYRTSDFQEINSIKIKNKLQAIFFQNQSLLLMYDAEKKAVISLDIETQSQVEIYKFDDGGVCPYINQLDLVKGFRRLDENYYFIYESMNQERQLVVLSSKKDKYPQRFIKIIRYDAEKDNKILRTRRVFQKFQQENHDFFCVKICQNQQFHVIYQFKSTQLIKGRKIVRKYERVNYIKCLPFRYPLKQIIIPRISDVTLFPFEIKQKE